jgi:two-component system phosphate regulon response regulator PhoB
LSSSGQPTVLIVDDEDAIREMVEFTLSIDGINSIGAGTIAEARKHIRESGPDLILLDWMLRGGESGLEFAKVLRADPRGNAIPIIMLTARSGNRDKVLALDAGADDYIAKPFSPSELKARIRAILRRAGTANARLNGGAIEMAGLCIDPATHRVRSEQGDIEVGPTEFRLLLFLMKHPERVYSRSELIRYVWPANTYVEERTVDVHIRKLRAALEPSGHRSVIQTVRGSGYRFSGR